MPSSPILNTVLDTLAEAAEGLMQEVIDSTLTLQEVTRQREAALDRQTEAVQRLDHTTAFLNENRYHGDDRWDDHFWQRVFDHLDGHDLIDSGALLAHQERVLKALHNPVLARPVDGPRFDVMILGQTYVAAIDAHDHLRFDPNPLLVEMLPAPDMDELRTLVAAAGEDSTALHHLIEYVARGTNLPLSVIAELFPTIDAMVVRSREAAETPRPLSDRTFSIGVETSNVHDSFVPD